MYAGALKTAYWILLQPGRRAIQEYTTNYQPAKAESLPHLTQPRQSSLCVPLGSTSFSLVCITFLCSDIGRTLLHLVWLDMVDYTITNVTPTVPVATHQADPEMSVRAAAGMILAVYQPDKSIHILHCRLSSILLNPLEVTVNMPRQMYKHIYLSPVTRSASCWYQRGTS